MAQDHFQRLSAFVSSQAAELQKLKAQNTQLYETMRGLQSTLSKVRVSGGDGPDIQRIENIPGQRIPFDALVDIPIGPNITSVQTGTITIPQNGPFVAVARYATFLSQYAFQQTVNGLSTTFNGRSFGRYRPIHSAWDLNDGQFISEVSQSVAFPGTGAAHIASPSNAATFRSMEGDFRIQFKDAGSAYLRSNIEVPSTFWTKNINSPFNLGALDFFERGSVLNFSVLPLHANNPDYGNVFGYGAPNPLYPFRESQWDTVEGILDPNLAGVTADPVIRAPSGTLTIGFHGYIISQPAGAGYV